MGDTVRFVLACDDTAGLSVSWEIEAAGIKTAYEPGRLAYSHAFAEAGRYLVFARFQGELVPATAVQTVLHPPTPASPTRSTSILHDAARRRVFAVNPDNHSLAAVDVATATWLFEKAAGRNPRTLALAPDGTLWVANQDDATVSLHDGAAGNRIESIALPHASRPFGIAITPDGGTAYVTLEAVGKLARLDVAARKLTGLLPICPTPRGLAISQDGRRILITRFLSPRHRGEVVEVDASAFAVVRTFALARDANPQGEINGHGVPNAISSIAISPDGRRAWVPHKLDNDIRGLHRSGKDLTFETTVRTAVAVLDLVANREIPALSADLDNRSLASAVAFDRRGLFGYVAALGSNQVDIRHGDDLDGAAAIDPVSLDHELAPMGVALDDKDSLLFVHYFLSREIGVYAVGDVGRGNALERLALVPTVAEDSLDPVVLKGKRVFYNAADPRMCRDKYLSCVVCHMDGGTDGRVWDFTGRGEGLRRTPSLLGRGGMDHGPVHWSANFDEIQDFEHDMRGPFGGGGFLSAAEFAAGTRNRTLGDRKAGVNPDLDALAAYVSSLSAARPSPYRNPDGTLTADGRAGREIFRRPDVACLDCHGGPRFTSSGPAPGTLVFGRDFATREGFALHDVGTLTAGSGRRLGDTLLGLDAPSLKGVWEGGPYLHDGSAATLLDVITTRNPADRHGRTSHLTSAEKEQLVAYLLQIDEKETAGSIPVIPGRTRPGPGHLRVRRGGSRLLLEWAGPASGPPPRVQVHRMDGTLALDLGAEGWRRQSDGWLYSFPEPSEVFFFRIRAWGIR